VARRALSGWHPSTGWLELYAKHFGTVEVNSTFYRLAHREAVARWVKQTPTRFCFAVKASRYLTHVKRLDYPSESLRRFYEPIEPLPEAGKLGPVLWQLPENFHRDDERLSKVLRELPAGGHAFEFRHPSCRRARHRCELDARGETGACSCGPVSPRRWWACPRHRAVMGKR